MEGVRAGGHARRGRHVRRRVLDRERRPDGRPHRRLDHRRAADDAVGDRVPGHARRREEGHPRGRRRDRWIEHPVRRAPEDGAPDRHRDEPARLALVRARLEGDRLSDRQDRRFARRRIPARRDSERHHEEDSCVLRAHTRLRRREGPALHVREISRRRHDARRPDEIRGRGDGPRPHVRRVVRKGGALPRDGAHGLDRRAFRLAARAAEARRAPRAEARPDLRGPRGPPRWHAGGDRRRRDGDRPVVPRPLPGGRRGRVRGPRGGPAGARRRGSSPPRQAERPFRPRHCAPRGLVRGGRARGEDSPSA